MHLRGNFVLKFAARLGKSAYCLQRVQKEGFEILAFSVMPTRLKVFTATLCPLVRLEACSTWPLQPVPSTCSKLYLLKSFSGSRLVLEHDERTPGLVLQIVVILSRTHAEIPSWRHLYFYTCRFPGVFAVADGILGQAARMLHAASR